MQKAAFFHNFTLIELHGVLKSEQVESNLRMTELSWLKELVRQAGKRLGAICAVCPPVDNLTSSGIVDRVE